LGIVATAEKPIEKIRDISDNFIGDGLRIKRRPDKLIIDS